MTDPAATFLGGQTRPVAGPPTVDLQYAIRLVALILGAVVSGAVLAYHPHHLGKQGSLDELDLPKIMIAYSVVGALAAALVALESSLGLAIFGVGSLIRFRTILPSAKETGRLILTTMVGFLWGFGVWALAIPVTVLIWLLVLILDWNIGYKMVVRGIPEGAALADATLAYQKILEGFGCRLAQVKKNLKKKQISIAFRASRKLSRDDFEEAFEKVDESVRGTIDWTDET
ncbi:MAG: hypothetical protein AAF488_13475 [Planctomycetota bacterium]